MTGAVLELTCVVCGDPFVAEKPRQGRRRKFCSPACRRSRHLSQLEGYRAEGRYEGRYTPRTAPENRRTIAKTCEVCQKPFQTTNSATVCCGLACGAVLGSRRSAATRTARSLEERRRVCEHCKSPFVARHPSSAGIAGIVKEGRFCSRRCADGFRRNGAEADQPFLAGIVAEIGGGDR